MINLAQVKITDIVYDMALPIAKANGCTVYDVEYKKEGSDYVLRVTLDMENDEESVSISMCESVSRALSEQLDKNDPTKDAYMLEVTSPGLDRPLKKDEDFTRFAGKEIEVGLYNKLNGSKLVCGTLIGLDDGVIKVKTEKDELSIKKDEASFVRLAVIF